MVSIYYVFFTQYSDFICEMIKHNCFQTSCIECNTEVWDFKMDLVEY